MSPSTACSVSRWVVALTVRVALHAPNFVSEGKMRASRAACISRTSVSHTARPHLPLRLASGTRKPAPKPASKVSLNGLVALCALRLTSRQAKASSSPNSSLSTSSRSTCSTALGVRTVPLHPAHAVADLPKFQRNAKEEFTQIRIPGAQFFDIDAIADKQTTLPHMLPTYVNTRLL